MGSQDFNIKVATRMQIFTLRCPRISMPRNTVPNNSTTDVEVRLR
jgi:hypothetical protein